MIGSGAPVEQNGSLNARVAPTVRLVEEAAQEPPPTAVGGSVGDGKHALSGDKSGCRVRVKVGGGRFFFWGGFGGGPADTSLEFMRHTGHGIGQIKGRLGPDGASALGVPHYAVLTVELGDKLTAGGPFSGGSQVTARLAHRKRTGDDQASARRGEHGRDRRA